jgi:hypothetical protein
MERFTFTSLNWFNFDYTSCVSLSPHALEVLDDTWFWSCVILIFPEFYLGIICINASYCQLGLCCNWKLSTWVFPLITVLILIWIKWRSDLSLGHYSWPTKAMSSFHISVKKFQFLQTYFFSLSLSHTHTHTHTWACMFMPLRPLCFNHCHFLKRHFSSPLHHFAKFTIMSYLKVDCNH